MPANSEIKSGKSENHGNQLELTSLPKEIQVIYKKWKEITKKPNEWLQDLAGEVAFTAGGNLTKLFGNPETETWKGILAAAEQGRIEIAGIDFITDGLALMGDFYRWLNHQNQCIDERLKGILESKHVGIHAECGACAKVSEAIANHVTLPEGGINQLVLQDLGMKVDQKNMQPIYQKMSGHHSTVTIFVDFHGDEAVVNEAKRAELMAIDALPFQVSLPVQKIEAFIQERGLSAQQAELLLTTLVQWNVQIARNIIEGHNKLSQHADKTLLVADVREVQGHPLLPAIEAKIQQYVQKYQMFVIS